VVEFPSTPKIRRSRRHRAQGRAHGGPPERARQLLGPAVAGEAEVPFFALTGSSFVEMLSRSVLLGFGLSSEVP